MKFGSEGRRNDVISPPLLLGRTLDEERHFEDGETTESLFETPDLLLKPEERLVLLLEKGEGGGGGNNLLLLLLFGVVLLRL